MLFPSSSCSPAVDIPTTVTELLFPFTTIVADPVTTGVTLLMLESVSRFATSAFVNTVLPEAVMVMEVGPKDAREALYVLAYPSCL